MEYLNEDNFKDMDEFIEKCVDTRAAVGDVDALLESIDSLEKVPASKKIPFVGNLKFGDETIEYYETVMQMGVPLTDHETFMYNKLLSEKSITDDKE